MKYSKIFSAVKFKTKIYSWLNCHWSHHLFNFRRQFNTTTIDTQERRRNWLLHKTLIPIYYRQRRRRRWWWWRRANKKKNLKRWELSQVKTPSLHSRRHHQIWIAWKSSSTPAQHYSLIPPLSRVRRLRVSLWKTVAKKQHSIHNTILNWGS